jgi:pilus assembly protein TadC
MSPGAAVWGLVALLATAGAVAAALPGPRTSLHIGTDRTGGISRGSSRSAARDRPVLRATATVAVSAGAAVLLGGIVGLVAAVVAGALCWRLTGRMEPPEVRRRRARTVAAVPHVVDLLAACLTAGLSPAAAVEQITDAVEPPVRDELAEISARLRLGVDPVTVWGDLARHPQLGGLGRTLVRAVESGASVADAMQRLADDLRRSSRADVESRARAVGVKAAVPLGVCLLPAFVLVGVVPLVAGSVAVLVGR